MNKISAWLDKLLMTSQQIAWLSSLSDKGQWSYDPNNVYPDAIINEEGCHTYLDQNAVFIYDKNDKQCCVFWPDWFNTRKRVCEKLKTMLGEQGD